MQRERDAICERLCEVSDTISDQGSPELASICFSDPLLYGDGGVAALLAGLASQRASTLSPERKA